MVIENKIVRISLAIVLLCILIATLIFILPRLTKHSSELVPPRKITKENKNTAPQLISVYGRVGKKEKEQFQLLADDSLTNKHKEYTVKINSDTQFIRKGIIIPYLLTPTPVEKKNSAQYSDLVEGMSLEISTYNDNSKKVIIAESIVLPRLPYILQGTIKSVENSMLTVDAAPVFETFVIKDNAPLLPKHETYVVNVDIKTEISSQTETGYKQYMLSDLQKDQMVVIYVDSDVTKSTQVTAARIEPVL